jgi:hypothetical protein
VDNSFYFFTIFLLSNALLESLAAAKSPASPRESKPWGSVPDRVWFFHGAQLTRQGITDTPTHCVCA